MQGLLRFTGLILWGIVGSAFAAERAVHEEPTSLEHVVNSTLVNYPRILAAQSNISSKQGYALAAQGAFDPRLEGKLGGRLSGYYSGQSVETSFYQPLPFMNAQVFAGYRVSDGSFPVYESQALTRDLGEVKMGFALSLLRDREIDERRARVATTELEIVAQQQQLTAEKILLLQQSFVTYSQWLLAWKLHDEYQMLLDIAVDRGQALQSRVNAGDAAEILLVENQQAVLQRQGLLVEAQRQIDMAAEQLSLYLRDDDGDMLYPRYSTTLMLPEENPEDFSMPVSQLVDSVLAFHPEIAKVKIAQEQAEIKLKLAENLRKPALDLRLYTTRDYGNGPDFLGGTDNVADVNFSIPLRTREASGKAVAAKAEIQGLEYQSQLLFQQLETDIRRALVNLDATRQLEQFAIEELAMTATLAEAEGRRFDAGLSDFFLLNIRERQIGEAQLKRWQAHLNHQIALSSFYGASLNVQALGLKQGL